MKLFNAIRHTRLWRRFWGGVWNVSEFMGIDLGRFASWVFHQMIGCNTKARKVN